MSVNVNLDALIPREDFEVKTEARGSTTKSSLQITDLESSAFFGSSLRKPDFQRETAEWTPKRVLGLIQSFVNGDLIPAVILWKNHDLNFVIDGSHRLSALMAWVQDDYGDEVKSQAFFGYPIPEEQIEIAQRTRQLVNRKFGTYKDHKEAVLHPANYGPEINTRARQFATLSLELQWVRDADPLAAEQSFIRINQQAAIITPQELELLKSRKKPNAIAARAVFRRGKSQNYWTFKDEAVQARIEPIARDIHTLLFDPRGRNVVTSLHLPIGGAETAGPALRMVFDFVNMCVQTPSTDDDKTGERTIEYLERVRRVLRLICSDDPSSLGLHPAVYFYSWTGKQSPTQFTVISGLINDMVRNRQIDRFIAVRAAFETYLINSRTLLNQLIRKFGAKKATHARLEDYYRDVLALIQGGTQIADVATALTKNARYDYMQPEESFSEGSGTRAFSPQVRSGVVMRDLLLSAPRCAICQGFVPPQATSVDHKTRREDGGMSVAENAQITHPYCNSGVKEKAASQAKAARPNTRTS